MRRGDKTIQGCSALDRRCCYIGRVGISQRRVLCLALVAFTTVGSASAQFNARGRNRARQPAARPAAAPPKQAPSAKNQGPQPSSPQTVASPSGRQSESSSRRRDELIARYQRLIVEQPGEEVPIKRLAQLVRERDGNLNTLLQQFSAQDNTPGDEYARQVAWGALLAEDGKPGRAIEKLRAAAQVAQNRSEAWVLLGRLHEQLGQKERARKSYGQAAPLLSGIEKTAVVRTLRDLALDVGDFSQAEALHLELLREASGSVFIQGELGRQLLARGHIERAVDALRKVAAQAKGDGRALSRALRDLGQAELQSSDPEAAIVSLSRASRLATGQPGVQREIDLLLAEAHRSAGTLNAYLESLEATAQTGERLSLLARLHEDAGNIEKAIVAYKKALKRAPRNVDVHLRLVRLFGIAGDLPAASESCAKLVRLVPTDLQLSLKYMDMLLALGNRERALTEWDRIERASRSDPEAGLALAEMAQRLGEPERETRVISRLAQLKRASARVLVELGARYFRLGKEEQARAVWDRILRVQPGSARAHVTLGQVLMDHEATVDGLETLRKAVELDPESAETRRAYAVGLERAATLSQGPKRTHLENTAASQWSAILLISGKANRLGDLARKRIVRIWKRQKRLEFQAQRLAKLLAKRPDDLEAGRLLAECHLASGKNGAAVSLLKKLLAQRKGDLATLLLLERAQTQAGDDEAAISTLKLLVNADPTGARLYYERMTRAATKLRDFDAATAFAQQAAQDRTDPLAQLQLARLYLSQGQADHAEATLRKALRLDDGLHEASLELADLLIKKGQVPEAERHLLHVVRSAHKDEVVRQASRKALATSASAGGARILEESLQRLTSSRPERKVYRELLLEVLSAEYYPLLQASRHFDAQQAAEAERQLRALGRRALPALLAALASEDQESAKIAIEILAHGDDGTASRALLTFAENSASNQHRTLALLAAGRQTNGDVQAFQSFLLPQASGTSPEFARAAAWALARQRGPGAIRALLSTLSQSSQEVKAFAIFGIADQELADRAQWTRVGDALLDELERSSNGTSQAAAALALGRLLATHESWQLTPTAQARLQDALSSLASNPSDANAAAAALQVSAQIAANSQSKQLLVRGILSAHTIVRKAASAALASLDGAQSPQRSRSPMGALLPLQMTPEGPSAATQVARLVSLSSQETGAGNSRCQAGERLMPLLHEEAKLALQTSPESALRVVGLFRKQGSALSFGDLFVAAPGAGVGELECDPREKAEDLREALVPSLLLLASGPHRELALRAVRLLRPDDSPAAFAAIAQALAAEDEATFRAGLDALEFNPSRLSVTLAAGKSGDGKLSAMSQETWSRRRRRAVSLSKMRASTEEPALLSWIDQHLEPYRHDSSPLVRQAARQPASAP